MLTYMLYVFAYFLTVIIRVFSWKRERALGYISRKFEIFLTSPKFRRSFNLKLLGNLQGNSYTKFVIVDMKLRFNCGK